MRVLAREVLLVLTHVQRADQHGARRRRVPHRRRITPGSGPGSRPSVRVASTSTEVFRTRAASTSLNVFSAGVAALRASAASTSDIAVTSPVQKIIRDRSTGPERAHAENIGANSAASSSGNAARWDHRPPWTTIALGSSEAALVVRLGEIPMVLELHRRGLSVSVIAPRVGINRYTVTCS